jgi:prevent-host-death family protein
MKKFVAAGRFKAECLALLDQVERTREPIVVTKRGRPVAEVVPVQLARHRFLRGSVTIRGNIVAPILGNWGVDQ